jgi:AraC-like DNA-binding protein
VAAYAREIATSEAALRKACVRVAGQSPTQLVQGRMLIEAERQLRYTGMSITQIAYYLGFEDPGYFSRFFAKGMGASPRSFRRGSDTRRLHDHHAQRPARPHGGCAWSGYRSRRHGRGWHLASLHHL